MRLISGKTWASVIRETVRHTAGNIQLFLSESEDRKFSEVESDVAFVLASSLADAAAWVIYPFALFGLGKEEFEQFKRLSKKCRKLGDVVGSAVVNMPREDDPVYPRTDRRYWEP